MYALPRELVRLNCDVRVILPRYACIPKEYQDKMIYRGEFYMDLGNTRPELLCGHHGVHLGTAWSMTSSTIRSSSPWATPT